MYWATDKEYNRYFVNFGTYETTNESLKKALYVLGDCGGIDDAPLTFDDLCNDFSDFICEEVNGGFDDGEFTGYKNVFDFIRDSVPDIYSILIPHEMTDDALIKIENACRKNGWKEPTAYTTNEMLHALEKEYNGLVPDWITCNGYFTGLKDLLDWFWDIDGGMYQSLYDYGDD